MISQGTLIELRNQRLNASSEVTMHYSGTGMSPLFSPGDILYLKRTSPSDLKFGEIVAYEWSGRVYVSRFIFRYRDAKRNSMRIVVKADNRHYFRRPLVGAYVGKVVRAKGLAKDVRLGSIIRRIVNISLTFLTIVDGLIWRVLGLEQKSNLGITVVARLFSLPNYRPSEILNSLRSKKRWLQLKRVLHGRH